METMKNALALAFLALFSQLAFGGRLNGKVIDSEGSVIENAVASVVTVR